MAAIPIHSRASDRLTARRSVSNRKFRDNLVRKLQTGEPLFPGIIGYDDTVIPQLVTRSCATQLYPARLRGRRRAGFFAGSSNLLDEQIRLCRLEVHDDPLARCARACRALSRARRPDADAWLPRSARFVEKLATPDVTIADMVATSIRSRRHRRASTFG